MWALLRPRAGNVAQMRAATVTRSSERVSSYSALLVQQARQRGDRPPSVCVCVCVKMEIFLEIDQFATKQTCERDMR